MCSRTAVAPLTFHDYTQQPLRELIVRGLLQIAELAGETSWDCWRFLLNCHE